MTTKLKRLHEAASDTEKIVVSKKGDYMPCNLELINVAFDGMKVAEFYEDRDAQLYAYLISHAADFIALIEAARALDAEMERRDAKGDCDVPWAKISKLQYTLLAFNED